MKNYKLSDETKTLPCGTVLHRVVATTTFTLACGLIITEGDAGGWIEKASNLSDNAWVYDDAQVYGNAQVSGDARISDDAKVCGNALISGNTMVYDNAWIFDNARVYGNALVSDNAWVFGNAKVYNNAHVYGDTEVSDDAEVYGNARVYGDAVIYGDAQVYGNAEVFGDAQVAGNAKVTNAGDYLVFKNSWSSGRHFTWTKSNDMWAVGCFYGTGDELIKKAYADSEDIGKHYEACVKLVKTL